MEENNKHSVQDLLMKKSGQALSFLAGKLLGIPNGEKIPTFSQLSDSLDYSRGTLQNAMGNLETIGAITLLKRGALGTFIKDKNIALLLGCTGISYISGTMPLPYTKIYEGLATGLFDTFSSNAHLSIDIAYMRGSGRRISGVEKGQYDFTVTSRLAAKAAIESGIPVVITKDFGPGSYLSGQSVIFRENGITSVSEGMKVGVDKSSLDHVRLTESLIKDINVTYVDINYNQILAFIEKAEIDAAVWNIDNILESRSNVNYIPIETGFNNDETTAVIVTAKDNGIMKTVLDEFLNVEKVLFEQKQVIAGIRYPNY